MRGLIKAALAMARGDLIRPPLSRAVTGADRGPKYLEQIDLNLNIGSVICHGCVILDSFDDSATPNRRRYAQRQHF